MVAASSNTSSLSLPDRRAAGRVSRMPPTLFLFLLFLLSLFTPLRLNIDTIAIYPSRLLLIFMFIPLFLRWVRSKDIGSKSPDIFIIAHVVWAGIAIAVVHGTEHIQAIGIYTIEVFGCYFLGRMTVKSPLQFKRVCSILVILVAFTIPFAAIESFIGVNVIIQSLGPLAFTAVNAETRLGGLYRAYAVFGHPILYGIVSGSLFCLCYYVLAYRRSLFSKLSLVAIPATAGFLSLSSAAFALITFQTVFILWDELTRTMVKRWVFMALLVLVAYLIVDLLSNRTPIEVFISYFSLDPNTAYTRLVQMDNVSDDIMRNWLFGIGFNDWDRPYWLAGSIDNFWLVVTVRYGLPGIALLLIGYLLIVKDSLSVKISDPQIASYRKGYSILLITMGLVIYTVHLWDEAFYLFVFFLGGRSWLHAAEVKLATAPTAAVLPPARSGLVQVTVRASSQRRLSSVSASADGQPHQVPQRRP